jgi:hypothetical protein
VRRRHRRSRAGLVVAGLVIVAAGFGVGLIEYLRLPKGSIWVLVLAAVAIAALVRALTRRDPHR